jgi:hypothetical protein
LFHQMFPEHVCGVDCRSDSGMYDLV